MEVFPAFREMRLAQGKIPLAQTVTQPQGVRQGFGTAVLQYRQPLADQIPHDLGRNASHGLVNGQNAFFLYPDGGDHAEPTLLVPVRPTVEGQLRFRVDLFL